MKKYIRIFKSLLIVMLLSIYNIGELSSDSIFVNPYKQEITHDGLRDILIFGDFKIYYPTHNKKYKIMALTDRARFTLSGSLKTSENGNLVIITGYRARNSNKNYKCNYNDLQAFIREIRVEVITGSS